MRRLLKWAGIAVGSLLGLVIVAVFALALIGRGKLNRQYNVQPESIEIPNEAAMIDRGQYLASISCMGCHGGDLSGSNLFTDPALGTIPASNLTAGAGGIGNTYSDGDFVRAIRHGIDAEGKPLAIMPSRAYWHYSDEDVAAIIAYVRSVPPVANDLGEKELKLVGQVLVGAGVLDVLSAESIDHNASRPEAQSRSISVAYGEYLVNTNDCRQCHGEDLSGGHSGEPGAPPGPNLAAVAGWTKDGFAATMRTGVTPAGRQLDPEYMPWKEYGHMNDDDLAALFLYLESQPKSVSEVQ